jgi:hypothetical protein
MLVGQMPPNLIRGNGVWATFAKDDSIFGHMLKKSVELFRGHGSNTR